MNKSYNTIGTVSKSNRMTVETDAPNIHNIHGPHPVPSINTCTLIKKNKKSAVKKLMVVQNVFQLYSKHISYM